MFNEDTFGIVVRSRFQEYAETEKMSLFHLNKEMKKNRAGPIDKLAKIVNKTRVIVDDQKQIEEMTIQFYKQLFQGHHRSDGVISDHPFEPVFDDFDEFTQGVGKLSLSQSQGMISSISSEEVEDAIKAEQPSTCG